MRKSSLSEDALLRLLVGALTATVAKILALRTTGEFREALLVINNELEELLGLKADLVRQLDDSQIVDMLTINDYLDVARLYQVAELFSQEGIVYQEMGQTEQAQISQIRALNLFIEVGFAVENDFLEADERIDELFDALGTEMPEDTLYTLFDYYEQVGAFDRAETAINQMIAITENNQEIVTEKKAFYRRLLEESDDELEAGGLTRAKIEQGLV